MLCLAAASCSRNSRAPDSGLTQAPVSVPDRQPAAAREDVPAERVPEMAEARAGDAGVPGDQAEPAVGSAALDAPDSTPAPDPVGDLEALPALPFDPQEPAVSEEEVALLDELLALSIPDAPRTLSHEETLLHTASELPLVMNSDVQRLIGYFTKNRRGILTVRASLGRGNAYRAMIQKVLEEEGVPAELYYLAMAESGFRPKARSHAYATGMWQFISSRGKQYGLRQDRYLDLRYDAETATRAAAKHLKDLHIEFKDWYLAMAAYNCGPNRVKSAIRRTGSRDFWTLSKRRVLPRETRNYVPIILAMTYVGKNQDLFELGELDPAPELRYDTVRTREEVSFELIADVTGSSVETVKELNPALFRSATPPYAYDLRLPPDSASRYRREIALVPPDKRNDWRRYEVRQGETLEAVAHRYKVKPETLAELNSLEEGSDLPGGARLTVPTTTRLKIYRYYGGGAGGFLEPGTGRYRIARGDTLGGIAKRFRTTVANLFAWNGLTGTRIIAGRYLIVQPPGEEGTVASSGAVGQTPTGRYTVRRGDSLSAIGARVGASVSQLRAWNGIRGSTIQVGQTLKVPGPPPAPPARTAAAGTPSRAEPAPSPNHYRIRPGDSLSTIADRFGVSVGDLRSWNGLRNSRITAGKYLIVRPTSGAGNNRAPVAARAAPASTATHYTVRRGDTLGGIAEQYRVTAAQLRRWNGIRGSTIHPGQRLAVREPGPSGSGGTPAPAAGSGTYVVRSGDTLGAIAERYRVTASDLRRWNSIRGSTIHPGQRLAVRQPASSGTYVVRRGDSLDTIARRHGTTVQALLAANGLSGSRIFPGQELALP